MTRDEIDTFTSTSVMVFGFGPFLFFSFPIFLIVLLITAVADAFASIFGLVPSKKHYFPKSSESNKTIEGYVGGMISTFLCTLFAVLFSWLIGRAIWPISATLIVAAVMSITFLCIDLITSTIRLQDNYINPLTTGAILLIILPLFGISIF
jgi:dolichol kinase